MVWAQFQVTGSKTILICACYRPPENQKADITKALHDIFPTLNPKHHIWIAVDFNLPGIEWNMMAPSSNCQQPQECGQFIEIIQDHNRQQTIPQPIRTTESTVSILDLFITNLPDMENK